MTIADALQVLDLIKDYANALASKLDDEVCDGRCLYDDWNEATDSFGGYLDSALLLMEKAAEIYEENAPENIGDYSSAR